MSTFKVERTKIASIWKHPNADRLELAKVEGIDLQFVVGKDSYQVGSEVIYFPLDSVLPQELIEYMGMVGKFSGKKHDRISTVKLRKEISQGFVCTTQYIDEYLEKLGIKSPKTDLTETLGVTKYDPPEVPCMNGNLVKLPHGVSVYDIEGVERYPLIAELLMDVPCVISEKMEGMNFSLTVDHEDVIWVNQRNYSIVEVDSGEHMFWKVARREGLIDLARDIKDKYHVNQVTLRGELIGHGIQKNHYNLKDHKVLIFDILMDGRYLDAGQTFSRLDTDILVPVLNWNSQERKYSTLREFLDGRNAVEASTGRSVLVDKLREGIVIKPEVEMYLQGFGRVIIKKRSPDYLAKTGH